MKTILFMAISLNGIIARENNEEDFLSEVHWSTMTSLAHKFGNTIWGRKTQQVVKAWKKRYHDDIKDVKKLVVSDDKNFDPGKEYSLVKSPQEALDLLEQEGFNNAYLIGGSTLNAAFAKEGRINQVIINIEPAIIGSGIPVFRLTKFKDLRLKLLEMKNLKEDIIQLRYEVL